MDKIKELGLRPAQERWLRRWIEGISEFIARGPTGEPLEERKEEYEYIKSKLMEKLPELKEYPERWRKKMLEILE